MASLLDGKKIIVTAGASGIGATTAKLMRDCGGRVSVCDIVFVYVWQCDVSV